MTRKMFRLLLADADKGGAGGAGDAGGTGDKGGAGDGKGSEGKGAAGDGDKGGKADGDKGGDGDGAAGGKSGDGDGKAGKGGSDDKGGAKDGEGKAGAGAPEKYELKLPEGQEYLDADDVKAIEVIGRAKGWSNQQAQAALEEHIEAIDTQKARFLEETKADPVWGGDKLDATLLLANKALDRLHPKGDKEGERFRRMLTRSGYGNNLAVISHLAKLGKMMAEDGSIPAGTAGGEKKSAEQLLYGGSTSKG